ncbi:MAG: diaminopimelate decarboxylase, partial [Actinomycetota bacterium]|nr:diaminopimelate decarboxylase [Actinomycetota bacterium]
MRAHEAGALHAEAGERGSAYRPSWLRPPTDVNALEPALWSHTARRRPDGVVEVGGVALTDLAAQFGTPAYVLDEVDFRRRAAAFRDAFSGFDVYYAGKAFMCSAVLRWVAAEGLHLDVCTGGELAAALRAGFDPARIGFHGNNKSPAELARALDTGVGRIIVDSFTEIERLDRLAATRGVVAAVLVRATVGVEAHTHEYIATAHEDQKFGFSIAEGDAFDAVRRVLASEHLRLLGLHSHIGSQIYDTAAFEVAARRVLDLHVAVRDELGTTCEELDLGGGFGIAYTTRDDPQTPAELARALDTGVGRI